jgi:RNA polymerase sigma-70 factor, ECF subfamily
VTRGRERDRQLVLRAQHGENIAFDSLVTKYQRRLIRMALRLVGSESEAEDVVQEAFIKAYRALPQFRGDAAFYTWLYRIAVNTARNYLESRSKRESGMNESGVMETNGERESLNSSDTPESTLMTRQVAETVGKAMQELPDDLRLALSLREIEGLSYDEIAEVMKCPIGTVRSRIFRAREAIAEKLRPLLGTGLDKRW